MLSYLIFLSSFASISFFLRRANSFSYLQRKRGECISLLRSHAASFHTGRLFFHLRQRIKRHRGGSLSSHLLKCAINSRRRLYRRFFSYFSFMMSSPFRIYRSSCRRPSYPHKRCNRAFWQSRRQCSLSFFCRIRMRSFFCYAALCRTR